MDPYCVILEFHSKYIWREYFELFAVAKRKKEVEKVKIFNRIRIL